MLDDGFIDGSTLGTTDGLTVIDGINDGWLLGRELGVALGSVSGTKQADSCTLSTPIASFVNGFAKFVVMSNCNVPE